ncbi:signal peptidase II [Antricoccus suffuscus]|uniref:Lipoprotein signal peptidase n=2 Tax=Antricoccus suffuscus TaxID=1629062 RepID=A0A2T0Z684_9ACTN|nr:signal peptidase II [Antricoccus suffuscus]
MLLLVVGAVALLLDILTKVLVVATLSDQPPLRLLGGAVYFTLARNSGAAFSLGTGMTIVFTLLALIVVLVIVRTARKLYSRGWAISLGLVLGGALGNLVDRMFRHPGPFRGAVIDFISVFDPWGRTWPIFNLADSAIVVGGVLAVILAFAGVEMDGTRNRKADR